METISVLHFYSTHSRFKPLICEVIRKGLLLDSKFSKEKLFKREFSTSFKNALLNNSKITDSPSDEDKSKFVMLFAAALELNFDDPNKKLGYVKHGNLHRLTNETLRTMFSPKIFDNLSEQAFSDTLNLLICQTLPEYLLKKFLEVFLNLNENRQNRLFEDLKKFKIRKIDADLLDFVDFKISLYYLPEYKNLSKKYREEFWNWLELKDNDAIKNPVKMFFERKAILEQTKFKHWTRATLFHLQKERQQLFLLNSARFEDVEKIKFRDYIKELEKIEMEIERFSNINFQRKRSGSSSLHHIFFPGKIYNSDIVLRNFRDDSNNKIRISKKSHEAMNVKLDHYINQNGLLILTQQMIDLIKSYRTYYRDEYLNFLELRRIFAEICLKTRPNIKQKRDGQTSEIFILASQFYELLRIQARYIKPESLR